MMPNCCLIQLLTLIHIPGDAFHGSLYVLYNQVSGSEHCHFFPDDDFNARVSIHRTTFLIVGPRMRISYSYCMLLCTTSLVVMMPLRKVPVLAIKEQKLAHASPSAVMNRGRHIPHGGLVFAYLGPQKMCCYI